VAIDIPADLATALAQRNQLTRVLGRGGMATVYLATDLKHRREVALKVLLPGLAAFLGTERFLKEIQIAAGLTHPHILALPGRTVVARDAWWHRGPTPDEPLDQRPDGNRV
jgi:hypothetical protein